MVPYKPKKMQLLRDHGSRDALQTALFVVSPGTQSVPAAEHAGKMGKINEPPVVGNMRQILVDKTRVDILFPAKFKALLQYPTAG